MLELLKMALILDITVREVRMFIRRRGCKVIKTPMEKYWQHGELKSQNPYSDCYYSWSLDGGKLDGSTNPEQGTNSIDQYFDIEILKI